MGLDVYLYESAASIEAIARAQEEYDAAVEKTYEEARRRLGLTPEASWTKELGETVASIQAERGIVEPALETGVKDAPSKSYPDHLFKVGYWRSSYNGGGINHVLGNATGKDLYWIAEPPGDVYRFRPHWPRLRERAKLAREEFDAWLQKNGGLRVMRVAPNMFIGLEGLPTSEAQAMAQYLDVVARHGKGGDDGYSCREGDFFPAGLKVVGMLPGIDEMFGRKSVATYVVYEDGEQSWYLHALEIVEETADFVLSKPDPDRYLLHWSG